MSLTLPFVCDLTLITTYIRHGLSYTTFIQSELSLSSPTVLDSDFSLTASVKVTNTGSTVGSEVVQAYISLPITSDLTHPLLQLKGFAKARNIAPGTSVTVTVKFDKYAVSYWSELNNTWVVEKGVYGLKVGTASDNLPLKASFEVPSTFEWRGL